MKHIPENILLKAKGIKVLVMDVDGVLTDGKLYFGNEGELFKQFSILDGLGIKMLHSTGISTAIITGRTSNIVNKRASELGINHVIQGRDDKLQAMQELLKELDISISETAYIGDDLPDLAAIEQCQFGITVANAYSVVKESADWVCENTGGDGAIREVADILLHANGHYHSTIDKYRAT